MEAPDFWDDAEVSQQKMKELKSMKDDMEIYHSLETQMEDMETMIEMGYEENDPEIIPEIQEMLDEFQKNFDSIRVKTLLSGEYDSENAIIKLNAGAGGTEAQDWAEMLYRMYNRWAERHHFKVTTLDYLDGDEAGLKSASILIEGENAYGFLKSESGVHRLVRVSPFDASGRRHTSFSAVEVMPEIDDNMEVDIRPEDIKMDVFRSSGAGGQHINKTSSAIRVTHIPTGTVVECQNERSQFQNKDKALEILRSRLLAQKQKEQQDAINADRAGQVGTGDRSEKIRTYNFPQDRCTDHRIGLTVHNLSKIMDGNLDDIIDALATREQAEKLQKLNT